MLKIIINNMANDNLEKARILKESLKIVDELAKIDFDDIISYNDNIEEINELIDRAKKLKSSVLWKLN